MIAAPEPDKDFPWWLVLVAGIGAYFLYRIVADDLYSQVLTTLSRGIGITVFVTLVGFALAAGFGLVLALGTMARWLVIRQLCRLYIEVLRGVPIIVLLLYVAFGKVAFFSGLSV